MDFRLSNLVTDLLKAEVKDKPKPRDEIWATDLGKPFIDRYYEMRGTPYSNPFTPESIQNFIVGSATEQAYMQLLSLCMLEAHADNQEKLRIKTPNCLDVVGRPDVVIEITDWDAIMGKITAIPDMDDRGHSSVEKKLKLTAILDDMKKQFPTGIQKTVVEIKTISIFALKYMREEGGVENSYPHYLLQLYTYMKAMDLERGHLLFIAKGMGKNQGDIQEIVIHRSEELERKWDADVRTFSHYFINKEEPPKEPLMVRGKTNWRVNYSRYKDLLYS